MWDNAQPDGHPAKHRWRPLFNATKFGCRSYLTTKMRKLLKLAGVLQTTGSILAASRPKFTIFWGHLEKILLLNKFFFPIVDTCLSCEDIARQSCRMVCRRQLFGDFLCPAFPASRVQHVSDMHLKFALKPHHVWKYGRHPIYGC